MISLLLEYLVDYPLYRLVSRKSSLLAKAISAIAVAALSCLSLGLYAVHTYRFFVHRKVQDIGKQLRTAVNKQDLATIQQLFKTYPYLQKLINPSANFPEKFDCLPDLLPLAALSGNREIVSFFTDNHADLEAVSRAGTSLAVLLHPQTWQTQLHSKDEIHTKAKDESHHKIRIEMIQLLLEKGAELESPYTNLFHQFIMNYSQSLTDETFHIATLLVNYLDCNPKKMVHSLLYYVIAAWWPKNDSAPPHLTALLEIMIAKGAHLRENEVKELSDPQSKDHQYFSSAAIHYLQGKALL